MSYCRWSSDDWKSDIYCYESNCGFQIHVAGRRVVGNVPEIDWSSPEALYNTYKLQMEFLDTAVREDINLPYDGESFSFSTPEATVDWLLHLENMGYIVPRYAIESLKEEFNEQHSKSN